MYQTPFIDSLSPDPAETPDLAELVQDWPALRAALVADVAGPETTALTLVGAA